MNNNSSFSKQDNVLAQSLDISPDIYKIPLSKQVTKESKQHPSVEPKSSEQDTNNSISNIMNSKEIVKCPCCKNEKSEVLSQNPIFVEKREGSDPVFLDESEIQPLEDTNPTKNIEKNEDIISSQILELIKQDNFDPNKFSI